MTPLSEDEKLLKINQIMQRKFGSLLQWERPILSHEFGPNNLSDVTIFERKLVETKALVFTELVGLSDIKIMEVASELSDTPSQRGKRWISDHDLSMKALSQIIPYKIDFGFGHPKFAVDFEYWGKMGKLSIYEVTALTLGANPEVVNEDKVKKLKHIKSKGGQLKNADGFLLKQFEIFSRHFNKTDWGYIPIRILSLKQLIDEIELDVHPELYSVLERRVAPKEITNTKHDQKKMTNQERETLLKFIAAMACEQYGYDPKDERSEVTRSILDDIEHVGLAMDAKTIRKWLKEASALVDPEYWIKDK